MHFHEVSGLARGYSEYSVTDLASFMLLDVNLNPKEDCRVADWRGEILGRLPHW